jgi:hypothetical protein
MEKIIFIDSIGKFDHLSIKNKSIGCTEYQFYNLIIELKKITNNKIFCYNCIEENKTLDDIEYIKLDALSVSENDAVIMIRDPNEFIINKIKFSKKNIFWRHGLCSKKYSEENKELLTSIITKFVFPSEYARDQFLLNNNTNKTSVIYNILYEDDFLETKKSIICKKNQIVFASAWHKGLYQIVDLFEKINKNKEFKFIFMCPGYGMIDFENQKKYIKLKLGDSASIFEKQDKKKYSKIIKESICVFAPLFKETFGCVFAESLYLGTPVIYDESTKALEPIVGNKTKCNYKDYDSVYNCVIFIKNNHLTCKLSEFFLLDYNIKLWEKIIKE